MVDVGAQGALEPLVGIACGGLGILLSLIGDDPVTGTIRYTFGWIYLWDGLATQPLTSNSEQFTAFLKNELEKWGKVIRNSGVKSD